MEMTTFLMVLFAICCVWFWVPDIIDTWYYWKYRTEDFVNYLRFKIKNWRKRE